ncbi:MAG TPA: nuclear transport factor 2 family protein [Abditibacteriaceae bacterium]|jgi:ketosteroid isomerase-like protein
MSESVEQEQIEATCQRYFAAFKAKDVALLTSMLAPDFEWQTSDGEVLNARDTAALLESYIHSFDSIENARGEVSDLSLQGDEATFKITEYVCGTIKDEQGNLQRVETKETSLDTMVRGLHGWQFKRAEAMTEE